MIHTSTKAVLTPQGPTLGFHEGQVLRASAEQLGRAGVAELHIDLGQIHWLNTPGLEAVIQILSGSRLQGITAHLLRLPPQLRPNQDTNPIVMHR